MIDVETLVTRDGVAFSAIDEPFDYGSEWLYVNGAIRLIADGTTLLDESLWDEVGQLWSTIGDSLDGLESSKQTFMELPGQPVDVVFERDGADVVIRVLVDPIREARVDLMELYRALGQAGTMFWARMKTAFPRDEARFDEEIERLGRYAGGW
ncbi:hypothetical protein [Luteipulveratus flavus]|uniref:Uncharacterized protein n=1 Tax=Luteipulveratus flavus TaxID=3031728 RepID=A0ABT6CA05_9MICO|nr:hypothetical protein [Luteipulveratus sp. YIM 133296]MDF8265187.1 hypothetical protein [Luteipulveratus sp. YIM 133296]